MTDHDDDLPEPMTIEEALTFDGDWHGIEPCDDCGRTHTPVWWHVDFHSEDTHLAVMLRSRMAAVIADNLSTLDTTTDDSEWRDYLRSMDRDEFQHFYEMVIDQEH
jgi:hypothetical protein